MEKKFAADLYVDRISSKLAKLADPESAVKMSNYMQKKFDFFGIKAQPRRKAVGEFFEKEQRPAYNNIELVIKKMWSLPEREYQYVGTELLIKYQQQYQLDIIDLFEFMLLNKSWWDTVDVIAKKLIGSYFKIFPAQIKPFTDRWLASDNIWLQRTCLLFQLAYKEKTDQALLFNLCCSLQTSQEFFIQKGMGWALREYSKTNPSAVEKFIKVTKLPTLTIRESLKIIKKRK